MMHRLYFVGPRERAFPQSVVVNTTSHSHDFGLAFSPFMNQGPVELGDLTAHNVENLWQFTKVYAPEHTADLDGLFEWKAWRDEGLADRKAHRYPMGKGRKPEFSLWQGERLSYVEARKAIYVPAYWQKLERYCQREVSSLVDMLSVTDVSLWDFDGYQTNDGMETILNNPERKMGHAFVLKKFVHKLLGLPF